MDRAVRFDIRDMLSRTFVVGRVMAEITQSAEDREYARNDLERGMKEGVYETLEKEEVEELVKEGKMVS